MTKPSAASLVHLRERDIQKQITDWLTLHRVFWYRNNVGAMFGEYKTRKGQTKKWGVHFGKPGMPDLVAVVNGRYVGIEVKRPGKGPSPEQEQFGNELTTARGIYFVVDCIEQFISDFEELERATGFRQIEYLG